MRLDQGAPAVRALGAPTQAELIDQRQHLTSGPAASIAFELAGKAARWPT